MMYVGYLTISEARTFETAFNADKARLLTSLESSCMANTMDPRVSTCEVAFEGSL